MKLLCEGFTEKGMRSGENQDAIAMFLYKNQGLFLVSDGMGGHSEGERASREIQKACQHWWQYQRDVQENQGFLETVDELRDLLALTSQKIWEETKEKEICGATVVLLWICRQNYALLWSGDSRCYQAERGFLRTDVNRLSRDDVWENQQELVSGLSREEIQNHPNRGKLLRAVGVKKNFTCTIQTGEMKKTTLFLLCSDGIYKYLNEDSLKASMKKGIRNRKLNIILEEIRDGVYQNHAPDNLSCVLVRFTK